MLKNEEDNIAEAVRVAAPWTKHREIKIPGCKDLAAGLAYLFIEKIQGELKSGMGRLPIVFSQGGNMFVLLPKSKGNWDCVSLGPEKFFKIEKMPRGYIAENTDE